jgi:hypothetical protein
LPKYIYKVAMQPMEDLYLQNAGRAFFNTEEERAAFNAELTVIAESPEQSREIRSGMTDLRMWELDRIEE